MAMSYLMLASDTMSAICNDKKDTIVMSLSC